MVTILSPECPFHTFLKENRPSSSADDTLRSFPVLTTNFISPAQVH